jgi:hypothetical protein
MTLIRLVRALPMPAVPSPRVLGVDDFSLRRRHRFGTVLVDVAASKVVDLLPDRLATSLSTWLEQHEPPKVICRDRAGDYANGARRGAPDAVQAAFILRATAVKHWNVSCIDMPLHCAHACSLLVCSDPVQLNRHLCDSHHRLVQARPNVHVEWRGTTP